MSSYRGRAVARALSPSLGIVRIGICVMEPFLPSTRPALWEEEGGCRLTISYMPQAVNTHLVHSGQIGVHVAGKATPPRHLLPSR